MCVSLALTWVFLWPKAGSLRRRWLIRSRTASRLGKVDCLTSASIDPGSIHPLCHPCAHLDDLEDFPLDGKGHRATHLRIPLVRDGGSIGWEVCGSLGQHLLP
jgi:hypothetical protein